MCSEKREYYIAWVLSSYDQYEEARGRFNDTYDYDSSSLHITYTLGRVGQHDVVIASPASKANTTTVEDIIKDLLKHFPLIRAGFVISTDAYVPRTGRAEIGDVVIPLRLPEMRQGIVHVDAEKTNKGERLFMTGQSGNVPAVVTAAIQRLRSQEGRDGWFRGPSEDGPSPEGQLDTSQIREIQSPASHRGQPQALYGIIASSREQITESVIRKTSVPGTKFLCYETAASTMKSRPLVLLAGVTSFCGEDKDIADNEWACKTVFSYLNCLTQHIDHHDLRCEPSITEYFEYEALDLEKPACRLLRLVGGTGELQCHIFQAYLPSDNETSGDRVDDETMSIPYKAVSYCWGSNDLTNTIRVNGKILSITSNLFQALGYLRLANRDCILWIDAICIDQSNALERGHQVDMMGRLYSQADEVLIWLGNIDKSTGELIGILAAFEEMVPREARRQWPSGDIRYQNCWDQVLDSSLVAQESLREKLELLTENPWFSRVWIIQEVANAKRASLGCKYGWIDARTFAVVPKLLHFAPSTQCQAIIDIMPGPSRKSSWFRQRPNLSTLSWRFRKSQASDPRDKLFALLGISSDRPISADYSKTEQAVVSEMMAYFFQEQRILIHPHEFWLNSIPRLSSRGLGDLIYGGADLDDLKRFRTRYTGPLLLDSKTVDDLRTVRSSLLVQLVQENSLVFRDKVQPRLKVFYEPFKRTWGIGNGRLDAEDDGAFVPMVLDTDRDIVNIHDAGVEATSNGPSALERFFVKYSTSRGLFSRGFGGQWILGDLQMLKGSSDIAEYFSGTQRTDSNSFGQL